MLKHNKKMKCGKKLIWIILILSALPVWWIMWFMITGSLMPLDELKATIGAAVYERAGVTSWPLFPSWPTLSPIVEILFDTPQFFVMFWNSFKLALPSVAGQLLIGAPAAWALSRFRFKCRKLLLLVYIILMLMPFQVTMVPNYIVANKIGLMDTIWAVIFPFAFSAFPVFIMSKGFDSVPHAMLEAAAIDGANYFKTFLRIGLPLGMPGVFSAMVLGFLECWNAIEQPMTFLKTKSLWPLSLYLPQIVIDKLGLSLIASLLMLAPPVLVFLFGQKYLELGIQASGIKE